MNDLEQRLQNAAEETRRLARTRPVAPPRARPGTRRHGLAIFATAFAVVIVLFGVLPWVFGGTETPALDDGASTTSLESTTSAPITDPACSASGIATPSPAPGLPEPAASTRSAIANAAAACDLGALESLASDIFTTSYGGGGVENLARWETDGEGRLGILLELLNMTYGTIDGGETTIYVWPRRSLTTPGRRSLRSWWPSSPRSTPGKSSTNSRASGRMGDGAPASMRTASGRTSSPVTERWTVYGDGL